MKPALSVKLPTDEEAPPPATEGAASFILGPKHFVKDNVAVHETGVVLKDAGRQWVVQPEALALGPVVGRGASAYVQRATHVPTSTPLALKVFNVFDRSKRSQLVAEIQSLYDSDCDALVSFFGAYYREGSITIALEWMDLGALSSVVARTGALPEPALAAVAFQVLWGLAYLRVEKRLHRDIKPSNLLCNSRGQVKLSDFGLSAEIKNSIGEAETFVGTCMYMAPERVQHRPYGYPSDIWALGLVLLEAALGRYPYIIGSTYLEMAETIVDSAEPTLPPGRFSADFCQFIGGCCRKNPDERLPADILLGSPWLSRNGIVDLASAAAVMQQWLARLLPTPTVAAVALQRMQHEHDDDSMAAVGSTTGALELL
jgi:mitogen-activated protein kinase kinase 3